MREKLPFLKRRGQLAAVGKMQAIAREELANCAAMRSLCLEDPRLGFHSEAEGYKFFPKKLTWRAASLRKLLAVDFPKVLADIEQGNALFPAYTGAEPRGAAYSCGGSQARAAVRKFIDQPGEWKAWRDAERVHFEVRWAKPSDAKEMVSVIVEPRRLWPAQRFDVSAGGEKAFYDPGLGEAPEWEASTRAEGDALVSTFSIPFKSIPWHDGRKPLRVNVCQATSTRKYLRGWLRQRPLKPRLLFGDHNSADLGWLFFPEK